MFLYAKHFTFHKITGVPAFPDFVGFEMTEHIGTLTFFFAEPAKPLKTVFIVTCEINVQGALAVGSLVTT